MILTYGFTVIIVGAWIWKMIEQKSFIFKRTPLDIPLLLFLAANILSTIFSMDPHTSIWGYYSRSNGGLLSLVAYLLLYLSFTSNMNFTQVKNVLRWTLGSGFLISLWAIFEHFGVSLSCLILRGELNDGCWIQDVQARVFASLGQPNWLAAYLAMLIFPAIYFLITAKTRIMQTTYYILLLTMYLAFTFTYSRGPTLGLIGGMVIFVSFWLVQNRFWSRYSRVHWTLSPQNDNLRLLALPLIFGSFLIINLLFGSALTSFRLISKFAAPIRPGINLPTSPSGTQLENGGTESGQIRFIVWQGAMEIFKHNPIFGSGLETFAYSYYQYRPKSHNLTSEWDFLYNKAHNEYLNYLATTGVVGFGTYLLVIGTFIVWSIKYIVYGKNKKNLHTSYSILHTALLASYMSYLVYNFFLFSVVIIAIFFYLFPAIAFVVSESAIPIKKLPFYLNPLSEKIAKGVLLIAIGYLLFAIFQLWYADTIFNQGEKASDDGNPGKAYNLLSLASEINSTEPFYRSELAYSAAAAASALKETDATLSAALKDEAIDQLNTTFKISPKNVSFWRTAVRTYFELSNLDKKYIDSTLTALDESIKLAPTDPKLFYNKALIYASEGKKEDSIKNLEQALKLKPNYLEVKASLEEATKSGEKP